MKKLLWMGCCAGLVWPVCAADVKPAAGAVESKPVAVAEVKPAAAKGKALDFDAGADLRVRQEVVGNLPVRGGGTAFTDNYIRYRPRVWGAVKNEDFKLYMRATDEMRSYFTPSQNRNRSNYRAPDEVFLDNLYLDFYNLFGGKVDIRAGRQDFYGANGPTYGSGRVILDGTPADGSRTVYMDAIRATIKFDDKNALDVLAIYNSPDNQFNVGHSYPYANTDDERPTTSIIPGSTDLTEWGGGLYFKSKEFAEVPFELYYLFKRETKARTAAGAPLDGRNTHTVGTRVMPKLSETLSAEVEGAAQAGEKDSGQQTSGYMGFAALTYKPLVDSSAKPYVSGGIYYLSGDKNDSRSGNAGNDTGWDPLWSRWPQFSELYVYSYNSVNGLGYWSNLIYPHATAGADFAPGHKLSSSLGPMYTAVEDGLGGGDGNFRGWLGMIRYDFPLVKNLIGKRGELFGHVTAEVLDPGDYYTSDKVAYFLRWEVNARF